MLLAQEAAKIGQGFMRGPNKSHTNTRTYTLIGCKLPSREENNNSEVVAKGHVLNDMLPADFPRTACNTRPERVCHREQ